MKKAVILLIASLLLGSLAKASENDFDYVVQGGDTLTSIIVLKYRALGLRVHMYGEDGMLEQMVKKNADSITDPHKIWPGTKVKFPEEMIAQLKGLSPSQPQEKPITHGGLSKKKKKIAQAQPMVVGEDEYVVQEGDTLASIIVLKYRALGLRVNMYGPNGMLEKTIQRNSGRITNPHRLSPGIKVKFPDEMVAVFQEVAEITQKPEAPQPQRKKALKNASLPPKRAPASAAQ